MELVLKRQSLDLHSCRANYATVADLGAIVSKTEKSSWGNKTEEVGTIKFVHEKGYGFVIREGTAKDAFFHVNRLPEHVRGTIKAGDRVRMVVGEGPKGPVALTIALLED